MEQKYYHSEDFQQQFVNFNRLRITCSEKLISEPETPQAAEFVFNLIDSDYKKMYADRIFYHMLDKPPLVNHMIKENQRILSNFCDMKYSNLDKLTGKVSNQRNNIQKFLNSLMDWTGYKIGNTASNITDSFIDRFTNDPMHIQLRNADESLQNAIDMFMKRSAWDDLLNLCIRDMFVMGIGTFCLSIIKDNNITYPVLEYIDPMRCSFVSQGAVIKYVYYKPQKDLLYIYTKDYISIFKKNEKQQWNYIESSPHPFGIVPIQLFRLPKGIGLFEKCLHNIAIFELVPELIRRDATDPLNNILTSNMQLLQGVHTLQMGSIPNISGGFEGQWLTKPERHESLKLLYDYSRYNISECTAYIFNQDFVTHPRETATKTKELMGRQQSLLRSSAVNLKSAMDIIIHGLANYFVTIESTLSTKTHKWIVDNLEFEPITQEVFSTYDIMELGQTLLPDTERIKFLKNCTIEQANALFEENLEQIRRKTDAQRGSTFENEQSFNPEFQ